MAVSSVLNGAKSSARISPETQDRIRKAAAELNYRPNVAARALANRRMNTIGVFVQVAEDELNHYFLEVFYGILEGAGRLGQNVTIFSLKTWAHAREQIERAFDGRIDGMILIAPVVTADFAAGLEPVIPCVTLHSNAYVEGMLNLESDEEKGAREMVRHLLDNGHRRILHLSGPRGLVGAERRIEGYRQALRESGIEPSDDLLVCGGYSRAESLVAMRKYLAGANGAAPLEAVFCVNDMVALGCIEALGEQGLRVPEDVSVCGFDDTIIARATAPLLTTVRQPLREMGIKAVSILIDRIEGREDPQSPLPANLVFPTELVKRASVAMRARYEIQRKA